ncbi:MAG: peptidoglycan DD-metalloendopeptidase family protein [Proteobacteria bacterium]|nr:peptidoglycan DD-metalloendopeptidase family protein [Pseudomonadota bacterium]
MSLISKDFRPQQQNRPQRHIRLRWVLLAAAFTGIGVVIASTNTENSQNNNQYSAQFDLDIDQDLKSASGESLPFKTVTTSSEEMARDSFSLSLPELQAQQKILDDANNQPAKEWREFTVKSGDNLARLFKRAKLEAVQLDELMKSGDSVKTLTKIFPKDTIRILSDKDGVLQALRYDIDHKSYLMVEREHGELVAKTYNHQLETREAHAEGVITSSLYLAAQEAGISQNIIMELASVFGWDIDFVLDIRKGDSFTVLYEEIYRNGEKISDGDILAAEFINDGKAYRAVRYTNPQTNSSEFYTPDGKSMRKAFLRTPVNFSRISSRFTVSRYHPVLHKFRSHKGVDYAAKRGTPIYAAGDGKVIFKGKKGGYGKVMIIQHGSKYTTLYAHLKTYNRKLRNGSKVKQGQTIAYVGSSGLATGPHLHYEFRVNGVHRNPLTVKLPVSNPVPKRYMADFELSTDPVFAQLDLLARNQQVALADTSLADTE